MTMKQIRTTLTYLLKAKKELKEGTRLLIDQNTTLDDAIQIFMIKAKK